MKPAHALAVKISIANEILADAESKHYSAFGDLNNKNSPLPIAHAALIRIRRELELIGFTVANPDAAKRNGTMNLSKSLNNRL